jgi:hypothetical protein
MGSGGTCEHYIGGLVSSQLERNNFIFLKHITIVDSHTYEHTLIPMNMHNMQTLPLHLRERESKKLIQRVLRLMKLPQAPRYQWECHLPLKEYSAFYETSMCQA